MQSVSLAVPSGALLEVYYGDQLVRKSGDAPTGNALVDRTFDNLVRLDQFVREQLGRKGWDDKNGPLRAQLVTDRGRNAYFDAGLATMFLGERNALDREHTSFGLSPTVMGHEIMHGVAIAMGQTWPRTAGEVAVDESFADVMGSGADDSNWILGDELPEGIPGLDVRDLANPQYRRLQDIPADQTQFYSPLMSYAAVLVANAIGKEPMRKLWYATMKHCPPSLGVDAMRLFADQVVKTAKLQGDSVAQAVVKAYTAVGIY